MKEPALKKDGSLYAETLQLRADELRVDDVSTEVGNVVRIEKLPGKRVRVFGRLITREWPGNKLVTATRRYWAM